MCKTFEDRLALIEYHASNNASILYYKDEYLRNLTQDNIKVFNYAPKYFKFQVTNISDIKYKLECIYSNLAKVSHVTIELVEDTALRKLIEVSRSIPDICSFIKESSFEYVLSLSESLLHENNLLEDRFKEKIEKLRNCLPPSKLLNMIDLAVKRQNIDIVTLYLSNEIFKKLSTTQYHKLDDLTNCLIGATI